MIRYAVAYVSVAINWLDLGVFFDRQYHGIVCRCVVVHQNFDIRASLLTDDRLNTGIQDNLAVEVGHANGYVYVRGANCHLRNVFLYRASSDKRDGNFGNLRIYHLSDDDAYHWRI